MTTRRKSAHRHNAMVAGAFWVAAILLAGCGSSSTNAEAEGAVQAPAPAASATTSVDPTPIPSTGVGQPTVATPTAAALPVSATQRQPARTGDIREVDFRNGFAYVSTMGDGDTTVVVTDGQFQNGEFGETEYYGFFVSQPVFGDVDGDGVEEAAVITTWNGGGTGFFDAVQIFAIEDDGAGGHEVVVHDRLAFGDRAYGGVSNLDIADGRLVVDIYVDGEGSCCPNAIVRELYGLDDGGLSLVTSFGPVRWVSPQGASDNEEITFLPGTTAAVLSLWLREPIQVLTFDAAAGQHVSFSQYKGPTPASLTLVHSGDRSTSVLVPVTDRGNTASVVLPESGLWRIEASFAEADLVTDQTDFTQQSGAANFLLSITDLPLAEHDGGRGDASVRRVVVQEEPPIIASASWPDFGSTSAGNLGALVEDWVNEPVDDWIAYATESLPLPRPEEGGEYQLHHRVTLVTPDLVSVHFDEYEYLCCRPYPNLRQRSLVVDVRNQRLIGDDEIIDLTRLDEVEAVWFAALEADDDWELDPRDLFGAGDGTAWSSLTLVPGGLTFGTDRQGAVPPIKTFVSFAELGDLVSPEIVRQVEAGSVPTGF